jgi:hypothetical protein
LVANVSSAATARVELSILAANVLTGAYEFEREPGTFS